MSFLFNRTVRLASSAVVLALGSMAISTPSWAVDLNVWMPETQIPEGAIEIFEKANPDIKVKLTTFQSEDYKTQLRVTVAAGDIPDVFHTNEGFTFFEYVDRGAALDLTDIAKEKGWDKATFPEFLKADSDKNGRIWGIPYSTVHYWQAVFYNKDFFDQNNIAIPTSIDELVATAEQVKAKGKFPVAFGDVAGWPAILLLGDLFLQQVDPTYFDKLNSGEVKWTESEPARKAFETIATMGQKNVFAPGALTLDHTAAIQSWISGRAVMLYNGTWWPVANNNTDQTGFTIGVMPLPKIDPSEPLKGTQFWGAAPLVISSKVTGEVKDAAIKFVDYLLSEENMAKKGAALGAVTTSPAANAKLDVYDFFNAPAFEEQSALPKTGYFDHALPIPVIEVIKVELQKLIQGSTTVDEALAVVEAEQAKNLTPGA